jgi:uncharacterized protein (DUF1697 family)
MADLKALIERLGYRDVRTLLNSGNVVFTAPAALRGDAAARIEEALATRLKVPSRVTVLDGGTLASIVAKNPFGAFASDPSRLQVAVPRRPADRARLAPLAKRDWAPEAFKLGARAGYLWCPKGQIDSPLAEAVAKAMGEDVTTRNWATMTRLQALAEAIGEKTA